MNIFDVAWIAGALALGVTLGRFANVYFGAIGYAFGFAAGIVIVIGTGLLLGVYLGPRKDL